MTFNPSTVSCAVILGLKETEERYYLLVKEPKKFREASMNCKLRGGTLAMPKTSNTNRLMADYVSQAGLTTVYIGVQAQSKDSVSGPHENVMHNHTAVGGVSVFSPFILFATVLLRRICSQILLKLD